MKRSIPFLALPVLALALPCEAQDDKILELGKLTYQTCVACHGPDGKGIRAGDLLMAPSLHESAFIKSDHPGLLTAIILKGILKQDNKYVQAMLPLEAILNDEQIAALIAYTTKEFGGIRRSPKPAMSRNGARNTPDAPVPGNGSDLEQMLSEATTPPFLSKLRYGIYEGKWEELPDFSALKPAKTGPLDDGHVSLNPAKDLKGGFGMVFDAEFSIPQTGDYEFSLTSDDGSALIIDGETVIGNDGIHPAKTVNAKEKLQAGLHNHAGAVF